MKTKLMMAIFLGLAASAHAKKSCTNEPKSKWMNEEVFKKQLEDQGYKIRKFKQPGTCYEIYGTNKEGKNVEIYFNPVDGSIVKEEIE